MSDFLVSYFQDTGIIQSYLSFRIANYSLIDEKMKTICIVNRVTLDLADYNATHGTNIADNSITYKPSTTFNLTCYEKNINPIKSLNVTQCFDIMPFPDLSCQPHLEIFF